MILVRKDALEVVSIFTLSFSLRAFFKLQYRVLLCRGNSDQDLGLSEQMGFGRQGPIKEKATEGPKR